jgi:ABC-type polar amino acid transport system ATPase subunit
VIRLEKVNKYFGALHVLKDLDLEVERGEVVVCVGPSGSGKSTMLRCINFLEPYDSGSIYVNDEMVGYEAGMGRKRGLKKEKDIARMRAHTGMVFQSFNLFPHKTVIENIIEAPVHVLGVEKVKAEEQARALLERMELSDKEKSYPSQLSGGQGQRVAIARSLAMDPDVMLFDEATSAIDPELVGEVLEVMRKLAIDGMTMIVVTHEMGFAREVADRIVFLEQGSIIEDATPDVFFNRPSNPRVRDFINKIL